MRCSEIIKQLSEIPPDSHVDFLVGIGDSYNMKRIMPVGLCNGKFCFDTVFDWNSPVRSPDFDYYGHSQGEKA